jgi:hypothetical protein
VKPHGMSETDRSIEDGGNPYELDRSISGRHILACARAACSSIWDMQVAGRAGPPSGLFLLISP